MSDQEILKNLEEEVTNVVIARDSSYGGFSGIAETCQAMKDLARKCPSWQSLNSSEKEGIDMILHKITRILYSPKKIRDSWVDIGGYVRATLQAMDKDGVNLL